MIKIIAIGNLLMGDDSIGLKIMDAIEEKIEDLNLEIKCIKAETDVNYALDNIEDGDFIFILDSTLLGLECGQITKLSLDEEIRCQKNFLSIHNMSLISLINHFNISVKGLILGIEVVKVSFELEISKELKEKFEQICHEVYTIIKEKSLEYVKTGENSA